MNSDADMFSDDSISDSDEDMVQGARRVVPLAIMPEACQHQGGAGQGSCPLNFSYSVPSQDGKHS